MLPSGKQNEWNQLFLPICMGLSLASRHGIARSWLRIKYVTFQHDFLLMDPLHGPLP